MPEKEADLLMGLFSLAFVGGFDLAAQWMGWENVFHCEWNEFGQKILKYYWPNAISYTDITKTDFSIHRGTIDILTGGFPCQPYSAAGKRLGTADDRHLWPEMLRAIREIQPGYVVGENVRGLTNWNGGMVFDQVQADLEAEGYQVTPFLLPACAVNAPHRRDRIWFVAFKDTVGDGCRNGKYDQQINFGNERKSCTGSKEWLSTKSTEYDVTHARSQQFQEQTPQRNGSDQTENGTGVDDRTERSGNIGDVTYANSRRFTRKEHRQTQPGFTSKKGSTNDWTDFPTQPPVCSRDDGVPDRLDGITFPKWRNESIKAYGNAIVPQIALMLFKAIQKIKNEEM